jgi:hypothetical protein
MKRKRTTKTRKKPHKGITLSSETWVKASEIKGVRNAILASQGQSCAITDAPLAVGCLDHNHSTGELRGVLLSEINMIEGRYLKLFNKLKLNEKYDIDFADMLCRMGEYLKQDHSKSKLHYKHMDDFRKKISRKTIPELKVMLQCDFGVEADGDKSTLVQAYVQEWVNQIEEVL